MTRFGVELEFMGVNLIELGEKYGIPYYESKKERVKYDHFHLKDEPDFSEEHFGGELISPIFESKRQAYQELARKLDILKHEGAFIPKNSDGVGIHIHLDKAFLKKNICYYQILMMLLFGFQAEIFDFSCGEHQMLRNNVHEVAHRLLYDEVDTFLKDPFQSGYYRGKSNCIRFTQGTFELRYFNSSLKMEILKRYIEFATQLSEYISLNDWDEELIQYYYNNWYELGLNPKIERKESLSRLLKIDM